MRILTQVCLPLKFFYIYYTYSFLDILKVKKLGELVPVYIKPCILLKTLYLQTYYGMHTLV